MFVYFYVCARYLPVSPQLVLIGVSCFTNYRHANLTTSLVCRPSTGHTSGTGAGGGVLGAVDALSLCRISADRSRYDSQLAAADPALDGPTHCSV